MFSGFLSFCFMGVSSNLEVFLSEKNLNDHNSQHPDSSLSLRPAMETLTLQQREDNEIRQKQQQLVQERDQEQHKEDPQQQQSKDNVPKNMREAPLGLNLKLEIPSYKEELDDSNDGFKTPTSEEHKIPTVLQCPPAPRKPKTLSSTKRKGCRCRIAIDLTSQEIESLFPMLPAVDLGSGGNRKKVKLFTE